MKKKIVLCIIVATFFVFGSAVASFAKDRLNPGEFLTPGQGLVSKNGKYTFAMQTDGNIVVRKRLKNGKTRVLWASGTSRYKVTKLIMQHDGNLVMYLYRHASWSTNTSGHPGAFLVIQNDGNAVIYSKDGKKPLWSTHSAQ